MVLPVVVIVVGLFFGYLLLAGSLPLSRTPPPPATARQPVRPDPVDEHALNEYQAALARDPHDRAAALGAADLLYRAQHYDQAVPFYRRAMAIDPNDADVSTALATALWRSGQTDAALAQLDASLAIDPAHAQTLFTKGVVEADGRHDYEAAVRAWTALLDAHPDYPRAETVRAMIRDTEPK